jgi:D-amino peptidase
MPPALGGLKLRGMSFTSSIKRRRALALTMLVLGTPGVIGAQTNTAATKKVYISVDMEGISGISGDDQLSAAGSEYGRSRKLMAEDTNAAIRGALLGGATDVLVNDSHGGQRNLLPEDLNPSARLISHSFKRHGMMEGLDETFSAIIFIGYHAKADTPAGLFAHTGSGVVLDLQINGRSVGEGGMNAALADWYGVPVVMVTGDDVAVKQVRESAKDARAVEVKRAINIRAVELVPLAQARQAIETAARESVAAAPRGAPVRAPEYRVTMRFRNFVIPEIATAFEGIERPAPDTVTFTRKTMPEAYRLIRVLYRFIDAS